MKVRSTGATARIAQHSWQPWTAAATAVLALGTACTQAPNPEIPSGRIDVPGQLTVDLWAPTLLHPQGHYPRVDITVCSDTESALAIDIQVETGIDTLALYWSTGTYWSSITPVLPPGCGTLRFIPECCYVPHYVTLIVTRA